jgi:heparan-alpha-glucosaminide N-acetyltransferase
MSATTSTTVSAPPSTGLTGQPVSTRILSIDIFRGFTMAVMVFVNDLADVRGLPAWTHHYPRDVDAMSYVDMVYPFFLFAVGLSLPLAVQQRLRRDPSEPRLWFHVLLRVFALLVLGLILANADFVSRSLTHVRGPLWGLLALLGAILLWAAYPPTVSPRAKRTLQVAGVALLALMLALFRRLTPDNHPAWLDFSYPEILGLIGLTYFAVCLVYLPTRRFRYAPLVLFALLVLLNIGITAHWLPYPQPMYLFPFDNGAMPSLTMAGIVVSTIFLPEHGPSTPAKNASIPAPNATNRRFLYGLLFAAACALLGLATKPLGISKIRATPSWALWSIAAATAIFALFYWLLDLRHHTRWAFPFRAPGANTLLTYLLPDLALYLFALTGFNHVLMHFNAGLPGIIRCLLFTLVILLLSQALTRARIRLQL